MEMERMNESYNKLLSIMIMIMVIILYEHSVYNNNNNVKNHFNKHHDYHHHNIDIIITIITTIFFILILKMLEFSPKNIQKKVRFSSIYELIDYKNKWIKTKFVNKSKFHWKGKTIYFNSN